MSISAAERSRSPHRWAGRLIFLGCVALAVYHLVGGAALETELRYRLGGEHARFDALELRYLHEGAEVAGSRFSFPKGAPPTFDHIVTLPKGSIEAELRLTGEGGAEATRQHRFEVPAEGKVVLPW